MRRGLIILVLSLTILLSGCSERRIIYVETSDGMFDFSQDDVKVAMSEQVYIIKITSKIDDGNATTLNGVKIGSSIRYTLYDITVLSTLKGEERDDLMIMFGGGRANIFTDKYYDWVEDIPEVGTIYIIYSGSILEGVIMNREEYDSGIIFNFGRPSTFIPLKDYDIYKSSANQTQVIQDIITKEKNLIEEFKDLTEEDIIKKYDINFGE